MSLSLQDTKSEGEGKHRPLKKSRRTRTKVLEKAVELIMSQEDDSDVEMEKCKENHVPVTLKAQKTIDPQNLSPNPLNKNTLTQTPRRSTRKSIKPVQEYEEIVNRKRQLRSASNVDAEDTREYEVEPQAKWTPAKVGRVSQKRGRKSRRNTQGEKNKSKLISSSENEDTEHETENKIDGSFEQKIRAESEIEIIPQTGNITETNMYSKDPAEKDALINLDETNIDGENKNEIAEENVEITKLRTVSEFGGEMQITQLPEEFINNEERSAQKKTTKESLVEGIGETNQEEDFGTDVQNNNLDMFDLGLNPLSDEAVEDENTNRAERLVKGQSESSFNKAPEVVMVNEREFPGETNSEHCEDKIMEDRPESSFEKSSESRSDLEIPVVTINDDTFNSSDCMLVDTNAAEHIQENMQTLRFSDDECSRSPPRKTPRIILTTDQGNQQTLNASVSSNAGITPKRYSKTKERKPTPFKPKSDVPQDEDDVDAEECKADAPEVTITVSTMEQKDIVLRSIRKRSLSVCIVGTEADNKRKNVTFYSPANQTTIFEEFDLRIVQSVKKESSAKSGGNEAFVTHRRKRSLSFDDALINKSKSRHQTPGKGGVTPQKTRPAPTKLPNFAAIHKKIFQKMENLVDHVNRKAERAKILTNSATKERSASAQKPVKMQLAANTTTAVAGKAKAVKRINLAISANSTFSGIGNTSLYKPVDAMSKGHNDSKLPKPRIAVCKPMLDTETKPKENREVKLPNPRLGIKPHAVTSSLNKQSTPAKNVLKATQNRQMARPAFNLSTALESHANASVVSVVKETVTKANAKSKTAPPTTLSIDEKMARRRQRHMDMFKGRGANARTTPGSAEKNYGQLIRGVRSNRRFELQMAHRMNMEH